MISRWVRTYQHLLPNAKAWRVTIDKQLTRFFSGLASTQNDAEAFTDRVFYDLYPSTTRQLAAWEQQFNLSGSGTNAERRDVLAAAWRGTGGQSPRYIQDQLRGAGFDVYVHEWFEPRGLNFGDELGDTELNTMELGGVADVAGDPVVRDPNDFLADEGADRITTQTGRPRSMTGVATAQTGRRQDFRGYLLTNRTGAGDYEFPVPSDPQYFPQFWYVGAQVFPDKAAVNVGRRAEFERLLLTLGPAQLWIGVLVDYTGTLNE